MKVTVYTLEGKEDVVVGTITYDDEDGLILSDPDDPILNTVATNPIRDAKRTLHPSDGEEFLSALYRQYRSAYLRVSKPDSNDAAMSTFAFDPKKHPRKGKGQKGGGQFVRKGVSSEELIDIGEEIDEEEDRPSALQPLPTQLELQENEYGKFIPITLESGQTANVYEPRNPTDFTELHARAGYNPFADRSPVRAQYLATPPTRDQYEVQREDIIESRYEELRGQYEEELLTEWTSQNPDEEEADEGVLEGIFSDASEMAYRDARDDEFHIDQVYAEDITSSLPTYYLNRNRDFTALYQQLKDKPSDRVNQLAMNDWLEEHGLDRFKYYFNDDDEDHPRAKP